MLDYWNNDRPDADDCQSASHACEEAVSMWLERRKVEEAGAGGVGRYDEDVVVAIGQARRSVRPACVRIVAVRWWRRAIVHLGSGSIAER